MEYKWTVLVNTNAAEIGRFLYFSGYEVYRVLTVPDVKEEIGEGFRMVQGVGGGLLMVNSTALITDSFGPNERGGIHQITSDVERKRGILP